MTQFLLSVHMVEGEPPPSEAEMAEAFRDVDALNEEMTRAGVLVFAGGLEPPDQATVLRRASGKIIKTDGPFAESKEQLGGFWVIEATALGEAVSWAERATVACQRPVEVRPFQAE